MCNIQRSNFSFSLIQEYNNIDFLRHWCSEKNKSAKNAAIQTGQVNYTGIQGYPKLDCKPCIQIIWKTLHIKSQTCAKFVVRMIFSTQMFLKLHRK